MELMQAHRQWLSRPDDERFLSLIDLDAFCRSQHELSRARVVSSRVLKAAPAADDSKALTIAGPAGAPVALTNWSFGQLAQRAGAPAAYLRTLPSPMAADCLNYGLQYSRDVENVGLLLTREDAIVSARAFTGPSYGRIWNDAITGALVRTFGDGVTGQWRIPGEFGIQNRPVTKQSTTLYASDRDMWVFLADESNRLSLPNRRGGKTGELSRGFFVWNSDVGAATFGIATFLFDYMCGNHIVWGAQEYKEIRIRHTAAAPDRFLEQCRPALERMSNASCFGIEQQLRAAQKARIDDVDAFLLQRFSKSQAGAIAAAHLADEERPIETLWDAVTGITAYARDIPHMNARVELEREAGKILVMATA